MTRRSSLSSREYRLLMAYLDGELSPQARARVEARLREARAWQEALQEARALKRALRQLPHASAPRAFTLTAAQAAAVRRPRVAVSPVAYRWASALAALLFVVLLAGGGLAMLGASGTAALPPETALLAAQPANAPAGEKAAGAEMPAEAAQAPATDRQPETAEPLMAPEAVAAATPTATPAATAPPAPTTAPAPSRASRTSVWGMLWVAAELLLLAAAVGFGVAGWRR